MAPQAPMATHRQPRNPGAAHVPWWRCDGRHWVNVWGNVTDGHHFSSYEVITVGLWGYIWKYITLVKYSYPLVMTNSLPWFFDGPNRNRWFTELNSMVDLSMAILTNNQMVMDFFLPTYNWAPSCR